jgi:hypothetical protein
MLRDGFLCGGGEEPGAHRLESNTPRKMAKNVQKNVWTFLSCKNVQMGTNIFLNIFFNHGMKSQNTQKITGWYKVYIRGISEPNKKQKKKP